MKDKESPKLSRKSSSGNLMRTVSKLVVLDVKLKSKVHQKAVTAKSSLAKKKSGGKSDRSDTKKGVSFSAETKPPDDTPTAEEDDMLPTLDEEEADTVENTPREDKENEDETPEDGEKEGEGAECQSAEGQEDKEKGTEEDDESKKGGKKGKTKKGKSKKDKKEEARKRAAAKKEAEQPVGEVTVGKEHFRSFIFEKVQDALSIVCTDGVTAMTVDNVQPLMKSLDLDPSQEALMDLIKDSLIDNFGEMNPLDVDRVVQEAQEANELTEMDDCLEVAFKVIDFDEDGFITQADIYQLMLRLGEMLADYALDDMLAAVDMDGDGKISLRDFRYFLLGRDVPSRKEVFAMAAEAKKKREEAEVKAEEDAERQKFEMLKSGQCAPEVQPEENSEPDAQGEGESDQVKMTQDSLNVSSQDGGESKTVEKDDVAAETVTVVASAGIKQDETATVTDCETSKLPEQSGGAEVICETDSPEADTMESRPGESEEIQEKRETLFSDTSVANNSLGSYGDQSSRVETIPNTPVTPMSVAVDSLSLPLPADGDRWRQHRRSSLASSIGASEDDYDFRSRSPIPLVSLPGEGAGPLHLDVPPPDLSIVHGHAPSPLPTPLETPVATPRRRPTIVGIGGLAVGAEGAGDTDQELVNAIELLRQQMTGREGNSVPERPHRRRNSRHSIVDGDGVNTVQDVEDFNNRLVFKLPPRRRSSTVPFPQSSRRNSREERQGGFDQRTFQKPHEGTGADSDEGIGLADEEVIVKSVYRASGSQAPPPNASALLRISLPSGDSEEHWVEHVPKPGPLPPPIVMVDPLEGGSDVGKKPEDANSQLPEQQNQWLAVAPNDDIESPRSFASRSELSAMNTSLTSPRTDESGSDDDDLHLLLTKRSDTSDGRVSARRPMSSRTLTTTRSVPSEYELDADSVICSINDDTMSVSSNQRHVKYLLEEEEIGAASDDVKISEHSPSIKGSGGRLTPTKPAMNSKTAQKASIPCNTIELKELDLKSPVTADQFSNRKRFGMIPRDVSKFLVLGKSPAYADSTVGANTPRSEQHVTSRGAAVSRKLSPTLRFSSQESLNTGARRQRPQTAITHRERDILQNRRISLMEDELLPLYDRHRNFDSPSALDQGGGSGAIEITTSGHASRPSEVDTLTQVKRMERRILKRSKTSFDLLPVQEGPSAIGDSPKMDRFSGHRSASASLLRRGQTAPRLLINPTTESSSEKFGAAKNSTRQSFSEERSKGPFTHSIVPITRVVMAYQNVRKRRQSREFNSLSRELERSGKSLYSASKPRDHSSPYALDLTDCKTPRSGKKKHHHHSSPHRKHSGRRNSTRSGVFRRRIEAEKELADFPAAAAGDDVPTLVGDLSDPDVIPDDVIFEKYRPHTTGGYRHRHRHAQRSTQSSILTLELPRDACHAPKVKSVSLLSKLPIK